MHNVLNKMEDYLFKTIQKRCYKSLSGSFPRRNSETMPFSSGVTLTHGTCYYLYQVGSEK